MLFVEYFWNGHFETAGFASRESLEDWKQIFGTPPNICEITTVSNFRKANLRCLDLFGNKTFDVELAFYKGYMFCRGEVVIASRCRVEGNRVTICANIYQFDWK